MGIQSSRLHGCGYHPTIGSQPPLKYWAMLCAIRRVWLDVPYPDVVEVMDSIWGEPRPTQHALDGKRIYPSRGMGGTSKKPPTTPKEAEQQLQTELLELESTDADVRAAAARYDQMAGWTPPKGTG